MINQTAANHSIKVIGHRNPDTDSICAAISYSRLKNQIDPEHSYEACRAGSLNRETEFALKHFQSPVPQLYADVSPQIRDVDIRRRPGVDGEMSLRRAWMTMRDEQIDTLCIVDGGDLKSLITVKDIATANMGTLDTHIFADAKTGYKSIVETLNTEVLAGNIEGKTVEGHIVIGAGSAEQMEKAIFKGDTCTIICQMYQENGVEIDPSTAGLMLSAILSDTLMFHSPTCTPADKRAAQALAKIAGVDLEEYADAMFEAGGDITGKTAEEIFQGDYKIFTNRDVRFGVGQASYMSDKTRKASQALVGPYLETALNKQGLDYIFYMFTDIRTSSTELLMAGMGADQVAARAFDAEVKDGMALLPGVVSRKKQMVPALMGAIKELAEEK